MSAMPLGGIGPAAEAAGPSLKTATDNQDVHGRTAVKEAFEYDRAHGMKARSAAPRGA
jgi:hypothetical protein